MKFRRIDVETVRCLISEEELNENGLDMDDFLQNGKKTEEFLRKIVSMAENEVGYKAPGGSLSVQASILPNHTLSLTLTEKQDSNLIDILESLRSAVSKFTDVTDAKKKSKFSKPTEKTKESSEMILAILVATLSASP